MRPLTALLTSFASAQSIVLENLAHAFRKPNIIDLKLGTVLHDDSASPEKRARMEKSVRDTTLLETGTRITGFQVIIIYTYCFVSLMCKQVYDNKTSEPVITPKSYGKSLKASELPDGMARFFPVASASASKRSDIETSTGLPRLTLVPILESLREDVAELYEALEGLEWRMVGGSLLIIYEADWERAAEGVKLFLEEGSEDAEDVDEATEEEDEDDDEDEMDGAKRPGLPYTVNLIDFAHTKITPQEGPDKGVLLGLSTVIKLLDGRIQELRAVRE